MLLLGPGVNELGDAEQLLCAAGQRGLSLPMGKPQSDSGYVKLSLLCMKNPKLYIVVFFCFCHAAAQGIFCLTGVNSLI